MKYHLLSLLLVSGSIASAERINQEGRILGPSPVVTNAILFNTSNADLVISAMQIFPVTNPWNECISNRPVLVNSSNMIAQINSDLGSTRRKLFFFEEMNFVFVPDAQPLVSNRFVTYPDDSDLNGGVFPYGRYPTPTNQPIEEWPSGTGSQTLFQWQTNNDGSDRHSIIVQPGTGRIYETWNALRVGTNWQAANGAIFNLNSNLLRPDGLTSGDAAGFPMFPALVRFDECERGMVEHACRLVVVHSRKQHIYPATHDAGFAVASQTNYPAMGQRLRLKADYPVPTNYTKQEKAILLGLKKYGAMVSDNSSSFFSISITPDDRWGTNLNHLFNGSIGVTNFEVIQTTGPVEGPRSSGAPVASAGPDTTAVAGTPFTLAGVVNATGAPPAIQWRSYSGPGTATFGNAALTNTTVTFNAAGTYTLELSADDGVHAVAYDAVIITVTSSFTASVQRSGTNLNVNWSGGTGPFVLERATTLPGAWVGVATTSLQTISIPVTNGTAFFRIRGN